MEKDKEIKPAQNQAPSAMVETYAEDVAKVIENDTEGLIKKIIHGEEEHEKERRILSPKSKQNKLFMLAGMVLVFLALATLSFFFFNKNISTVEVKTPFIPIIFTDQSTFLEVAGLKKDEIAQTVLNEINTTKVKNGGVEGIYLTENKQTIGLRRFIALLKSSFVPDSNPLLVQDNFLMGAVNDQSGPNFFILLKVRSTADIFSALRAWENNLLTDLHGFLGINVSSDTNYLFSKEFQDGIVENKNARILYDQDGNPVLMYIFADDNSVIITGSPNAALEVMLRLASSQTKQ